MDGAAQALLLSAHQSAATKCSRVEKPAMMETLFQEMDAVTAARSRMVGHALSMEMVTHAVLQHAETVW